MEKWAVLVTPENQSVLTDWYRKNINLYEGCDKRWDVRTSVPDVYFHYPQYLKGCHSHFKANLNGWEIITFEQWKQQYCCETYEIY